jgi:hypothetical protein
LFQSFIPKAAAGFKTGLEAALADSEVMTKLAQLEP